MNFKTFKTNVERWATERGIYEHSTDRAQLLKALSELGELADAVIKDRRNDLIDAVGDVAVCMVNYAKMAGVELNYDDLEMEGHADTHIAVGAVAGSISCLLTLRGMTDSQYEYHCVSAFNALGSICVDNDLDFGVCCLRAWDEIKDRVGTLSKSGAFVKEGDV